jgi:glutaredoxin
MVATVTGRRPLLVALLAMLALACGGNPLPGEGGSQAASGPAGVGSAPPGAGKGQSGDSGEAVTPPFSVSGELEGLLVVWFDEQGAHTAGKRADIPEAHRQVVRVDSLAVAPDKRLDADHVYVADVRAPGANGRYPVRKATRAWLEAQAEALAPSAPPPGELPSGTSADVTLYGASWCGACKATARYFHEKGIAFTEKDIEKDSGAQAEMLKKAQAAGKTPHGIPVIDFRGNILLGFDRGTIDRLIAQQKPI